MAKTSEKAVKRKKRQWRLRSKLAGNAERPRLAVFRSLKHIYAQLIDDESGRTLAATSTKRKEVAEQLAGKSGGNVDAAKIVGRLIAESAKAQGVSKVCFDRGGFRYHGRVKALADAAREAGLEF